jgi:SAM-dependent methyltransferase
MFRVRRRLGYSPPAMTPLDVVDLRNFYASPLGAVVARVISQRVMARWREGVVGASIVGLGYATPYLAPFRADAMRTLALMPAEQGVVHWPGAPEPSSTALVDGEALPLPSGTVDRVLLVHHLEVSRHPAEVLGEVWRVLEGGGRLMMVVPARRGWWSGAEWTPFGHGRPYSKGQLTHLLRESWFSPLDWSEALHFPPSTRRTMIGSAMIMERMGSALGSPFAGVHVVEATKQIFSPLPARKVRFGERLAPVLVPEPAGPVRGREGGLPKTVSKDR